MAKKETTKQPRAENEKFAKTPTFVLNGKNGRPAFLFESLGDLKTFAKQHDLDCGEEKAVKPPKNPDCEPATKGYVKSLIRKTIDHTHIFVAEPFFTVFGTVGGLLATIVFAMGFGTTQYFIAWGWYPPVGPSIAFTLTCFVVFLDSFESAVGRITDPIPTELQKYTPPACEKKDECEE